jgi:RNA polymerase sigma factor (sigma-70 family)
MENQNTSNIHQSNWEAYLEGNDQSFEDLYLAFAERLYVYGCNLTIDKALVEDAIQEIFCKLYQRDKGLIEVKNIRSYLFVALRNHIRKSLSTDRNHEKHQKRYQSMQPVSEEVPVPSVGGEGKTLHLHVQKAIEQLPPRQKEVLCLRFLEGFDYYEISDIMKISYQVARNYASRGMKRLRNQLFADSKVERGNLALAMHG